MFEKNLQDLIRALRKAEGDPSAVAAAIADIKTELKSRDIAVKTQALQKLTYVSHIPVVLQWDAPWPPPTGGDHLMGLQDRFMYMRTSHPSN